MSSIITRIITATISAVGLTVPVWSQALTKPVMQVQAGLDLDVHVLSLVEREQANVSHGLRVEAVRGAVARAGILTGDIVISVNGTAVNTPEELHDIVIKASKTVAFMVQRGEVQIFVPVKLP